MATSESTLYWQINKWRTVDSSAGREPLAFTVGAGQMIKGFDSAIPVWSRVRRRQSP